MGEFSDQGSKKNMLTLGIQGECTPKFLVFKVQFGFFFIFFRYWIVDFQLDHHNGKWKTVGFVEQFSYKSIWLFCGTRLINIYF